MLQKKKKRQVSEKLLMHVTNLEAILKFDLMGDMNHVFVCW